MKTLFLLFVAGLVLAGISAYLNSVFDLPPNAGGAKSARKRRREMDEADTESSDDDYQYSHNDLFDRD